MSFHLPVSDACAPVRAHVRAHSPRDSRPEATSHWPVSQTPFRAVAAAVVLAIALSGCARKPETRPVPPLVTPAEVQINLPQMIRVGVGAGRDRRLIAMPLEEYVLASVLSELAPTAGEPALLERAFEVQAVIARTYGVANLRRHSTEGFDLCDTTHCQVVDLNRPTTSRWATIARRAVEATRGTVVTFNGAPAAVLFHSDCGGARSSATEVWGGSGQPYLAGGPDPLPDGSAHATWRFTVARERLQRALNSRPMTAVGRRLDTIDVQSRDSAGRARLVLLNGERAPLVRGEDLRAVLNDVLGPRAVRSARFEVRRDAGQFIFEGQGYGHGVGLCQKGALARAAVGQPLETILGFYFPGTRLVTVPGDSNGRF